VVTGPIANSVADLTLLYAVMANINYPGADARKPGAPYLRLPGVAEAAAAAAAVQPKTLSLPRVLLEVPADAASSLDQVALTELQPLKGLRVGVFSKVSICSGSYGMKSPT
jgi:Asp-tRNA(Asn)/Glu-tRNA(Gln) amidotransferase A subunit family amidase